MRNAFRCTLLILTIFGGFSFVPAESTLSWRIFNKGENTWVYNPTGLMMFSTLSRTVKPVTVDPVRSMDTITDCIEYDGYLWASTNAGIYQVDMSSQSSERISMPDDVVKTGKLALDIDYMWLGTGDTLFQFDKLGREWFTFSLPEIIDGLIGVWSNGDEVFCLGRNVLLRFTTSTEKWNRYTLEKPLGDGVVFYPGESTFKVVDGKTVALYDPASFSWKMTEIGLDIVDLFEEDNELYCTDGQTVNLVNAGTGMIKPLNLPKIDRIERLTLAGDSLVLVTGKRVGAFSVENEIMNYTDYQQGFQIKNVQRVLPLPSFLVIITDETVVIYEKTTKAWQYVKRSGLKQKVKAFSWDEEECALRFGKGNKATLSGNVEMNWNSTVWDSLQTYADVNLHMADTNDRMADVFFKNRSIVTPPKKGIYYRGNRDDYLNTLEVGSTDNGQVASPVLPEVTVEGGSAVIESKQRLKKRDRKVARLSGGSGYITSRTVIRKLPYRADGTYDLRVSVAGNDTIRIIPESEKVMVDGVELDPKYYTFSTSLFKLQFITPNPIDPVSSITIEYKVETRPEGDLSAIEFKPSYHYGKLHYGDLTISPKEWISARIGYTGIDRDSLNNILTAAVPVEFRSEKKDFMLKATPEYAYNVTNGTQAGNMALQSRFGGSTGLLFNGRFVDSSFVSTDTLTRGFGTVRSEYDLTFNHDIRQELPLTYYQHQRFAEGGSEERYEFNAGVHYTNFPFLDLTGSRTIFDKSENDTSENSLFDSLFHKKDKLAIRLYETSSPYLEKLTRFKKIAYEIVHSEYRANTSSDRDWNSGRVSTGSFTLIPIDRIILLGEVLYRGSMEMKGLPSSDVEPSFNFQMVNVPNGVDISGFYNFSYKEYAHGPDYSTNAINRTINFLLKPGQWYAPLGWFSPRLQLSHNVLTSDSLVNVPVMDLITGLYGDRSINFVKEVGVNIFPMDGVLLTNTNKWSENNLSDNQEFISNNRLQFTFNSRNILTANYDYDDKEAYSKHNAFFNFERRWTPWFTTTPGAFVTSTYSLYRTISTGPTFLMNINLKDIGIIRMLNNVHNVKVEWKKIDEELHSVPDFSYTFNLILRLKPNLVLNNMETLKLIEGNYDNFSSSINLLIYF